MANQYNVSSSSLDTFGVESSSLLTIDCADDEEFTILRSAPQSGHSSFGSISANSTVEVDSDDNGQFSSASDEPYDVQQDPVALRYRSQVSSFVDNLRSQQIGTSTITPSNQSIFQRSHRIQQSSEALYGGPAQPCTAVSNSLQRQHGPAGSTNPNQLFTSYREPRGWRASDWDSDDDPEDEEGRNLVMRGQHFREGVRPQQPKHTQGVCPQYLRRIPRLHLLSGSTLFFQVEIKLSNGKCFDGFFLPEGPALREGKHRMSVEFFKQAKKNVAFLVRGTADQSNASNEEEQPHMLSFFYAWITDSVNLDHSKAVPVIQIKQKDLPDFSCETEHFEITVKNEIPSCVICAEEYEVGQCVLWLVNCGHFYHESCGLRWLQNHNTCPTCRDVLPFEL